MKQSEITFPNSAHGQKFRWELFLGINAIQIVGGPVALWYAITYGLSLSAMILFMVYTMMRGIGISVGYHRMLTHRSFKTHSEFLRKFLFYWGGVGGQNTLTWRANHDDHHRYGDTAQDPYSVYWPYNGGWRGAWWAHIGALWHAYEPTIEARKFAPDDPNKRAAEWEAKYHVLIFLSGFLVPFLLLGWKGLIFVGFTSLLYVFHMTWLVNSVCHLWGTKSPRGNKKGRNNLFVIILGFVGEGFHANHHADPRAAILGPKWWHLDMGKWVIRLLEYTGLVYDVKPRRGLG